jgi:MYXO-CTERM domain-containing protein
MRKLVLALAILALPGLAMAQPNLDATQGGLTAISVPIGAPITVDVDLGAATTVNSGLQYNLTVDAGASDALFTVQSVTDMSPGTVLPVGGFVAGTLVAPINLGASNPTAEGYFNIAPYGPGLPIAQWVLTCAAVGVYTIQADTPMNASNGADGIPWTTGMGKALVVTVTPEPATALLLLGALPFLRRRR